MKLYKKIAGLMLMGLPLVGVASCSDAYMEEVNSNYTKAETLNPNYLLTTSLLQTYGDFQIMDTYRCYIQGYTQHLAGGWNVGNYAGANLAADDMMRSMWTRYYAVAVKSLVDAERLSKDMLNVNAIIRIHKAYMFATLTDTYGDIPCMEAGKAYTEGIANPKYDKQEDIYNWIFQELEACIDQLGKGSDNVTGDVTGYNGNTDKWKKFANTLRMRYAMRISDVNPAKAKEEFEKALSAECGYIASAEDDAYVKHYDGPFTLYAGARDYDFRSNALSEMNYGQDIKHPAYIASTFFNIMKENNDPRLYRICRHYNNANRLSDKADINGNLDVTDEVIAYEESPEGDLGEGRSYACKPGQAYYSDWVEISDANMEKYMPEFKAKLDNDASYKNSDALVRMLRPFLSLKFERSDNPGILMTSAEVEFLLAEAKLKGWSVDGEADVHYHNGIDAAMKLLNTLYKFDSVKNDEISQDEIDAYKATHILSKNVEKAKEQINTEAWILHFNNPTEAWANMRRADYPTITDRTKYSVTDFTEASNLKMPTRLQYPHDEVTANADNYQEAIDRMGGEDDWHARVWWDVNDYTHVK